ncbi:MAG: hypothetical protein K0S10_541, partial [Rubrobacteraceae bacterium]|nr:hypothetical protein [Rubrobacteraceae bacterium]
MLGETDCRLPDLLNLKSLAFQEGVGDRH